MDAGYVVAIVAVVGAFCFIAGYCIGADEGEKPVSRGANGNYIRLPYDLEDRQPEDKPIPPQGGSGTAPPRGGSGLSRMIRGRS